MIQVATKKEKINLSKMIQRILDGNAKKVTLQRKCEPWDKRRIKQ